MHSSMIAFVRLQLKLELPRAADVLREHECGDLESE